MLDESIDCRPNIVILHADDQDSRIRVIYPSVILAPPAFLLFDHQYLQRYIHLDLFERSEFLIDTSQKKSLHACTRVRLLLVLVLGRQIVYGQNTVYLCLSKYIVFENTQL